MREGLPRHEIRRNPQRRGDDDRRILHHFSDKEDLGFTAIDRHMEKRRQQLEEIEQDLPSTGADDPLERVFRRLDAIREMVRRRHCRKGGCIIGNLSTALSDIHDKFRRRLAECFDEMALEFKPHLDAAVRMSGRSSRVDTWVLARYIVAIIEGSIMLTRTQQDKQMMTCHFDYLKEHLSSVWGLAVLDRSFFRPQFRPPRRRKRP